MLALSATQITEPETTHKNVKRSTFGLVLKVQSDQMLGKPSVHALVDLVQHEVQEIESRDQRRREVDVLGDGPLGVWIKVEERQLRGRRAQEARAGRRGVDVLYLEPTGLAAARMDVRALRVVMIPALAIETVCCSCWREMTGQRQSLLEPERTREERAGRTMTSCKTLRVASDILSNSSMQQTPPSLKTRAPLRSGADTEG